MQAVTIEKLREANMDHDAVIAINEVTVLIVVAGIGIVALIGAFLFVSASAILSGNRENPERFRKLKS